MCRNKFVRLVIGVIALATLPFHAERLLAQPRLPDSLLASTRGASVTFTGTSTNSCSNIGAAQLFDNVPVFNGNVVAANCSAATLGLACGGCTLNNSSQYGTTSVPAANGQSNNSGPACGNLETGTCQMIPVPPYPGLPPSIPGCANQVLYRTPNGNNAVPCGNLKVIGPQGAPIPVGPVGEAMGR